MDSKEDGCEEVSPWTDEARAAVVALEDRYGVEVVSAEHHEAAVARLEREIAEISRLVRDIHQCIKRGEVTEDHGLIGNLRCILDHVAPKPPL